MIKCPGALSPQPGPLRGGATPPAAVPSPTNPAPRQYNAKSLTVRIYMKRKARRAVCGVSYRCKSRQAQSHRARRRCDGEPHRRRIAEDLAPLAPMDLDECLLHTLVDFRGQVLWSVFVLSSDSCAAALVLFLAANGVHTAAPHDTGSGQLEL